MLEERSFHGTGRHREGAETAASIRLAEASWHSEPVVSCAVPSTLIAPECRRQLVMAASSCLRRDVCRARRRAEMYDVDSRRLRQNLERAKKEPTGSAGWTHGFEIAFQGTDETFRQSTGGVSPTSDPTQTVCNTQSLAIGKGSGGFVSLFNRLVRQG